MEKVSTGTRWVEQFLLPVLRRHGFLENGNSMSCLQIDPDDDTEAQRLEADGHRCDVLDTADVKGKEHWIHVDDVCTLPFSSERYDLVLTGYAGRLLARTERHRFVRELRRICRPNGAFLTAIGNRWCPLDLTRNASLVHGLREQALLSLSEAEQLFVDVGGFSRVDPICVTNHFGWTCVGRATRLAAWVLEANWRWLAVPRNRFYYSSPFNPVLMLWIPR